MTTRSSLLRRIRDRDDAGAWREFDGLYRPLLMRYARLRGLDRSAAEDVVQHCMLAIQSHIGKFDYDPARGRFKAWLRTLVNNRIRKLARVRREQRAGTRELAGVADNRATLDEVFERVWLAEHLRHCLRDLRDEVEERTYQAFERYVIDQAPVETVCAELNLSAQQLYRIKWRLTRKLKERMQAL